MENNMKNEEKDMPCSMLKSDKLKVTCVERRYRVSNSKLSFMVTAKKEFDDDVTQKLLHEDMELKTFLSNYDITDVSSVSSISPVSRHKSSLDIAGNNENEKILSVETGSKGGHRPVRNHGSLNILRQDAVRRRELFDSLTLQETFSVEDYRKAIEEKGIVVTNSAMPYDDLKWLTEKGKIERASIGKRGKIAFKKKGDKGHEEEIVQ